jgi:lysophospholipase L1-like esterase
VIPRRTIFRVLAVGLGIWVAALLAEVALRLADFNPARLNPGFLQFGYQTGIPTYDEDGVLAEGEPVKVRLFQSDPDLFWAPIPGTRFTTRQGFRGTREYPETAAPGTLRILFLGDSCTFLGDPVYPEIVERELSARMPGRTVEALNASAPGYTSFQGRKLIEKLARWRPNVVGIYFGWNDHWPGQGGLTDRMQASLTRGSYLFGLLGASWALIRAGEAPRVPPEDFRRNLEAIREAALAGGATPLFITAPTGFRAGAMPEWATGFFGQFYRMSPARVAEIPAVHARYAAVVREVAAKPGCILVDAEKDFREANLSEDIYFRRDRIHLQPPGHERLARAVVDALAAGGGR